MTQRLRAKTMIEAVDGDPVKPGIAHCAVGHPLDFSTDHDGRLVQSCACGSSYVALNRSPPKPLPLAHGVHIEKHRWRNR